MPSAKTLFLTLSAAAILAAQDSPTRVQRIASQIRPNDLKADVSFLASDALQGRATPSPGLDIAAEYIAAQFRRAGLEPVGDDGYFQTASYNSVTPNLDGLQFSLGTTKAGEGKVGIMAAVAVDLQNATAFKVSRGDAAALDTLTVDQVRGKVLLVEMPQGGQSVALFQSLGRVQTLAAKLEPALIVLVRAAALPNTNPRAQLRDAGLPALKIPTLAVGDKAIFDVVAAARPGPMEGAVSAHIAAPVSQPVKVRNVVGLLRGSDPRLKDSYIVITGHYDHLGVRPDVLPNQPSDNIYNGANDDASGTASVIEIANAITAIGEKPRRSIVFMTVFGEEIGGFGARWYTSHPIFPIAGTIADINLEHLGRTDDNEGPNIGKFNLTGFDYTISPPPL